MNDTTVSVKSTPATLKAVADYFRKPGETLKGFSDEWKALPDKDKNEIKEGLGNGSLTY